MPIQRIERESLPYVRPAYEPDTRTLRDLLAMAGQARAQQAGRRGQVSAQGWMTLGDIVGSGIQSFQDRRDRQSAMQAAALRQQQEDALKQRDQDIRAAEVGARIGEREEAGLMRREVAARQAREDAQKMGDARATAIGYGPMAESDVDTVMQSPSRSGDVRYAFGPGTAEGPELMPTASQRRQMEVEKSINAMGGQIGPNGQVIMPPKPETPESRLSGEDLLAYLASQGNKGAAKALEIKRRQNASGAASSEPLVQIVGPDGKPVYAPRSQAIGKQPPSGSQKPATGLEKRALNFYNRAAQADIDLESFEPQIQQMGLGGQAYMELAPNFMQSDLGQQYTQAQRAFTEARLRKDSGAAIPEQEFVNDRKTYFAQPGDSKDTLEQKRRARAAVLASLGFESGQALGEYLGDTDEAARVVQSYRTRSQKQAAASSKVRMQAPDGSVQEVDPSMVDHYTKLGAKVVK